MSKTYRKRAEEIKLAVQCPDGAFRACRAPTRDELEEIVHIMPTRRLCDLPYVAIVGKRQIVGIVDANTLRWEPL